MASECIVNLENYGNVFNADALNDQTKAWRQLEEYLKIYENTENFSHYKKIVMDTIFSLDSDMVLPKWFIEQYKKKHTEDAVRIYLKYNRIEDATKLLIHQCQKYIESCAPPKTRIWISYALLDQVKLALKDKIKDLRFEKLKFEKYVLGFVKYDESDSESNDGTNSGNDSEVDDETQSNIGSNSNSNSESESDSEYHPNSNSEPESESENHSESENENESESITESHSGSEEEGEEEEEEEENDNEEEEEEEYKGESEFSEEDTKIFNENDRSLEGEEDDESDSSSNIQYNELPSSSVVHSHRSSERNSEYERVHKNLTDEVKQLEKLYLSLKQKIDVVLKL